MSKNGGLVGDAKNNQGKRLEGKGSIKEAFILNYLVSFPLQLPDDSCVWLYEGKTHCWSKREGLVHVPGRARPKHIDLVKCSEIALGAAPAVENAMRARTEWCEN